jgi:hypothetical protein
MSTRLPRRQDQSSRTGAWLRGKRRLGALAAVAATGLAALAATSTAQATTASPAALLGWNLAYQTHGGPNQEFVTITAPTRTDAWAAGITTNVAGAAGYPTGSVFAHWNGHSWTAASIKVSAGFVAEYAYSSSPSNVWIFGRARKTNAEQALVYNGKTWSSRALPGMIDDSKVALLGPSDLWAGTDVPCPQSAPHACTILMHWNGKTWQAVKIAGLLRGGHHRRRARLVLHPGRQVSGYQEQGGHSRALQGHRKQDR